MDNTTQTITGNSGPSVVKIDRPYIFRPKLTKTQLAARRARKALEATKVISIQQLPPVAVPVPVKSVPSPAQKRALTAIENRIRRARIALRELHKRLDVMADECGVQADVVVERQKSAQPHVIIRCVSEHFDVPVSLIRSDRRDEKTVLARHVSYFLCAETGRHLAVIGRHFGRDHTSIISGVRKMERVIRGDKELAAAIDAIRQKIQATIQ